MLSNGNATLLRREIPDTQLIFGPVPSRRLGRSLGVNNIPPKRCSYSCVYCQLGSTVNKTVDRTASYDTGDLLTRVSRAVDAVRRRGENIDYITFVADGEPTLDVSLGAEIRALRKLGSKVAVITNSSLIWRDDVRSDLAEADWVSLKVDCVDEATWYRINRPHKSLELSRILDGAITFSREYGGKLVTETMLVENRNSAESRLREIAKYISALSPDVAYLSVPIRPPAQSSVHMPREASLTNAYEIFASRITNVEYLIGYEGNAFSASGDSKNDLLSITSVHPMKREAVQELLARNRQDWSVVEELLEQGTLVEERYGGNSFYIRKLHHR